MDSLTEQTNEDVEAINAILDSAWAIENLLVDFRNRRGGAIHPWALPSLANAIGSIQATQSHLRAAKHHLETPEPSAEFVKEK